MLRIWLALLAVVALLAACGGGGAAAPTPTPVFPPTWTPAASPTPKPTNTPVPTRTPRASRNPAAERAYTAVLTLEAAASALQEAGEENQVRQIGQIALALEPVKIELGKQPLDGLDAAWGNANLGLALIQLIMDRWTTGQILATDVTAQTATALDYISKARQETRTVLEEKHNVSESQFLSIERQVDTRLTPSPR
jgi:hypothetical protein